MAFDLNTLAQSDTAVYQLRHPKTAVGLKHEDGKPVTITVSSQDSPRFKAMMRLRSNKRMDDIAGGGAAMRPTMEQMEIDAIDTLVAATVDWNIEVDGAKPKCTEAEVRKLYSDPRFGWVRLQIDAFIGDRGNFIVALKPPS